MKIAIAGKGGTGKTTLVGSMARELAAMGHKVTAIDVDPNPTLANTIGISLEDSSAAKTLPFDAFERIMLDTGSAALQLTIPVKQVLDAVALHGPDGINLIVAGRVEHAARGCNCATHAAVRAVLAAITAETSDVVLVDMEAGVEHFSRANGTLRYVDGLLILVEPFYKSLVTARTVVALSSELGIEKRYVVANKVRNEGDLAAIEEFCRESGLELIGTVPYDLAFPEAETREAAPIDEAPDAAGVVAARTLAHRILEILEDKAPAKV